MPPDIDYSEAIRELRAARSVVITAHVKPDGDALGSAAALRRWLLSLGKTVRIIVPTSPAPKYVFLDPDRIVQVAGRDVDLETLDRPDIVCIVDTCTRLQLEGMEALVEHSGAPVLAIDHHHTQDPLADFLVVDSSAAATAVIVYRLLLEAGATIDPEMAMFLLSGLATDTDWFRLATVDPTVFRLAADLVEAGAKPHLVFDAMYMSDEFPKVLLRGRGIEGLRLALEDRVAIMRLPRALFRELGADIGDTENLITECMKVRGVQVGVMMVETSDDEVRVSLRSRPPIDVLRVVKEFGGGGHLRAGGARLRGSMDDAERRLLASIAVSLDAAINP
jgi:bifunctional oligoribonuclease and PAP phosphatase NrnA